MPRGGRRWHTGAKSISAPLLKAAQLLYSGPWVAERTAAIEDFLRRCPGAIHPVVRAIIAAGAGTSGVQVFRGAI